jgi:predicted hydrocarbon binding protein
MNDIPCSERVFALKLAYWLPACYKSHLRWLRHLLERLGRDCTLLVWQDACRDYDDELLLQILRDGWKEVAHDEAIDAEASIAELFPRFFPVAIEGVSKEEARRLVEMRPPIRQVRQTFTSLNVWRETTTYETLHLASGGLALLTEALMRFHGKQGELIAYDLLREGRISAEAGKTGSVAEFISDFTSESEEANIYTAGLREEIVHTSEREVVVHIKECEWARYFRERHPKVGYLMACSTDEAAYRAFNRNLRLQRTSTLMEGGKVCDFRIYAIDEVPDSQ